MSEFKPIADGMNRADTWFIDIITERGFTEQEARHVLRVYRAMRVIKIDHIAGNYRISHGALLDTDVLRNAVAITFDSRGRMNKV